MFSNNVLMRHILLRIVDIQTSNRVVKIVKNVCYIGSVWFSENARERKLRGKMEEKKKVRKGI